MDPDICVRLFHSRDNVVPTTDSARHIVALPSPTIAPVREHARHPPGQARRLVALVSEQRLLTATAESRDLASPADHASRTSTEVHGDTSATAYSLDGTAPPSVCPRLLSSLVDGSSSLKILLGRELFQTSPGEYIALGHAEARHTAASLPRRCRLVARRGLLPVFVNTPQTMFARDALPCGIRAGS